MFYVCEGQIPSAMPRSKCSCQRIAYRSHANYITTERSVLWKHKQQNGCQFELTMLLYRVFSHLSAIFWIFILSIFGQQKRQFNQIAHIYSWIKKFRTLIYYRKMFLASIDINGFFNKLFSNTHNFESIFSVWIFLQKYWLFYIFLIQSIM